MKYEKGGMNTMHLQEETLSSKTKYEGPIFTVTSDIARLEDGETAIRDVVRHSGGVCVIPVTDDGIIYLVKQFRYPFGTTTLEIPAGKLEKGEFPEDCGRRELTEETGLECREFIFLGEIYPTPAYDTEIIYLYMARKLAPASQKLDGDEFLDVVKMPLHDAVNAVMDGDIKDGKTQIAILKAARILGI